MGGKLLRRNRVHLKPAGKPSNLEKTQSDPNPKLIQSPCLGNAVPSSTKLKSAPTKPVKSAKKMELVVAKRTRSGRLVKVSARVKKANFPNF